MLCCVWDVLANTVCDLIAVEIGGTAEVETEWGGDGEVFEGGGVYERMNHRKTRKLCQGSQSRSR